MKRENIKDIIRRIGLGTASAKGEEIGLYRIHYFRRNDLLQLSDDELTESTKAILQSIKKLQRLNGVVSFLIAVLFSIFSFVGDHNLPIAVFRFIQSFIFTGLLTFGNLVLLSYFIKENQERELKIKKIFYILSYSLAALDKRSQLRNFFLIGIILMMVHY